MLTNWSGSNSESPAVPPPSGLLELPSLGAHVGLGVAVRDAGRLPEVLHSLPGVLGPPEQNLFEEMPHD